MQVEIPSGFWAERQKVNAECAIFHQWRMLTDSGCIENFRIAAGESSAWREGWFFADSDAYKWLDAAARILACRKDRELEALVNDFIVLLGKAQEPDGYIFTYNQVHFTGARWQNLQIEHELYCHGHLIEAGVSHFLSTGQTALLEIARKAADRVCVDFQGKGPLFTPGHEEIEIALLRLFQVTGHTPYLNQAEQFIRQRGKVNSFGLELLKQQKDRTSRAELVKAQRQKYITAHPDYQQRRLPPGNAAKKPKGIQLRWAASVLSGKYFQQHQPADRQRVPEGHAVRFTYLAAASALLDRLNGSKTFLPALETAWERMVTRRMYLTGGLGSLPVLESFGRDYELDPEYAYAETCAAIGSLLWTWEMAQGSEDPRYSDLMEWQLYNAFLPGLGLDGDSYLYNNPLACRGGISRKPWFEIPCCPSNLSRILASLQQYIYSTHQNTVYIHQYISSAFSEGSLQLEIDSRLPWNGKAIIQVIKAPDEELVIRLRIPSWSEKAALLVNGEAQLLTKPPILDTAPTACGIDPRKASWHTVRRTWKAGDQIELELDTRPVLRYAHPRLKVHRGQAALTCGPLVYCLESIDNPDMNIFDTIVDPASFEKSDQQDERGFHPIHALSLDGYSLVFIPYWMWGNRGASTMTVWFKIP
jgi:hypothetical protein